MKQRKLTVALLAATCVVAFFLPVVSQAEISECYYYTDRRAGVVDGYANCTGSGNGCMVCFDNVNGGQCAGTTFCEPHPRHRTD